MFNFIRSLFVILICVSFNAALVSAQDAAIIPPAKTTFFTNDGKPLTSGKVYFYVPNTSTLKTTWQDADQSIANTNPVILDASGRAIIYGDGSYRQVVRDRNNNLIWDGVTASTGSGGGGSTTGDGDLVGTIKPWAGLAAPNQYLFSYGQEISRSTYSVLYTAITLNTSVFCTNGSPTLTGIADTTQIPIGSPVEVSCLTSGTTVVSKTSSAVTTSNNASLTTSATATFLPWGGGNGTTTFNLPDLRGRVIPGRDNMGGTAASRLTTTYFANASAIGAAGGTESKTLVQGNLPAFKPAITITDPGHTHSFATLSGSGGSLIVGGGSIYNVLGAGVTGSNTTGITAALTNNLGSDTPFSIVQPSITANYIIKVTPDTVGTTNIGVTSLGSMTGDIACGDGLLCTGNTISVSPNLLTSSNIWSGLNVWGTGTWVTTPSGVDVTNSIMKGIPVSSATQEPVLALQKTSTYGGVAQALNSTLYVTLRKNTSTASAYATSGVFETVDLVGGTSNFVEGVRAAGTLNNSVTSSSAYGGVFSALAGSAAFPAIFNNFLVGTESETAHFSADAPLPASFNPNNFSAGFLATNSVVASAKKSDAGFMVNGFSMAPYRTGFMVMSGGAEYAALLSKATTVIGVDMSQGVQTSAALAIPNATAIKALNAAGSSLLDVVKVDNSDRLVLSTDTASIRTPKGMAIDGGSGIGYTVQDGTVTAKFETGTLFTNSAALGTSTNHNLVFLQNNTLRGYFDTSGVLNLGTAGIGQGALAIRGTTSGAVTVAVQAAAGTYNFNLPTSAGSSGQPLLSAGGGSSPMTFGTLGVGAGGTGLTAGTSGGIPYFSSSSAISSSAALTANAIVKGGGAGGAPVASGLLIDNSQNLTGIGPLFETGSGVSTSDVRYEAGGARTGDGATYFDLHTTSGSDYEARWIRNSGTNGSMSFNNTGSGSLIFSQDNTGAIEFSQSFGTVRFKIATGGDISVRPDVATPASGSTSARLLFGTTAGFGIYYGSGAPTVSAAQGSLYMRSDGTANNRLYINTNGSTTWTAFNTTS